MSSCNRNFAKGFQKIAKDHEAVPLKDRMPAESSRKLRNRGYAAGAGLLAGGILASRKGYKWTGRSLKGAGISGLLLGYAGENELYQRQRQEAALKKTAAPSWFYKMNKKMNTEKKLKNISTVGLKNTKIGQGLK